MLKVSFLLVCCAVAIKAQYSSYPSSAAGGYSSAQGSVLPRKYGNGGAYGSGGQAKSLSSLYRPAPSQFAAYQPAGSLSAGYGSGRYANGASTQYGAPGGYNAGYGRYTPVEDPYSEPANYEFSYQVSAPEYGVEFGHQETRRDEQTAGQYNVLLPDGRTQIVQYEADQGGYRPTITYQEPAGGYGGGAGGYGNGGYAQGGGRYAGGNEGYVRGAGGNGNAGYAQGGGRYAGGNEGYARGAGGYGNGGYAQGGGRYAGGNEGYARGYGGAGGNYGGASARRAY